MSQPRHGQISGAQFKDLFRADLGIEYDVQARQTDALVLWYADRLGVQDNSWAGHVEAGHVGSQS